MGKKDEVDSYTVVIGCKLDHSSGISAGLTVLFQLAICGGAIIQNPSVLIVCHQCLDIWMIGMSRDGINKMGCTWVKD